MAFFTTNDGVSIHYEVNGTGKPLVMIHGWDQSSKAFCKNVPVLAEKYQVVTVDMRGHGDSGKPAYGYRIARLSKDLEELLEYLDLRDVTLFGWSMGCSVIWGYWDLFRDKRVSKMILCDEAPLNLIQEDNPHGFVDYAGLVGLSKSINEDPNTALAGFDVGMFIDPEYKEKYLPQFVAESVKFPAKECAFLLLHHCYADWRDVIPTITVPTLIIAGLLGGVVKPEANQWNRDHIPGAEMVTFDSGHVMFLEQSEKFNKVVADFIG